MTPNGAIAPETEGAFVEWINSFSIQHPIDSLQDLNDGQVLWQMLREIEEYYFSSELPNNKQTDYSRLQNLKFVHARIQQYLDEQGRSYKALTEDDFQHFAKTGPSPFAIKACPDSLQGPFRPTRTDFTEKFLRMILLVMLDSPKLGELVKTIQHLPESTQTVVGTLMQEMMTWDSEPADGMPDDGYESSMTAGNGTSPTASSNPERKTQVLELEEHYARIMTQLEHRNRDYELLDAEMLAISDSLARSQETNEALNAQIVEKDEHIKKLSATNSEREHISVKEMELQISSQEEIIAGREAQLGKATATIGDLKRQNMALVALSDEVTPLKDEVAVLKKDLMEQTKKANTANNYMKKLQASREVEKERDTLRSDLEETKNDVASAGKVADRLREENFNLRRSDDERSRTLSLIEREYDELRITKKQLRDSREELLQQVQVLNERVAQDQETIADLRERAGGLSIPTSPGESSGLERELLDTSKLEDDTKRRIINLEKEKKQLDTDVANRDEHLATLRQQLEISRKSAAEDANKFQETRQENIALQTSLSQVHGGHPIEGTEIFKSMRDKVKAAEAQRNSLQQESDKSREQLESLRSDHSLVDKTKLEKLDELKKIAAQELVKVRAERDELKQQISHLQAQLDGRTERTHFAKMAEILKGASPAQEVSVHGDAYANSIQSARERTAKQTEQVEQQGKVIKDLERQLEQHSKVTAEGKPGDHKSEDRRYTENLERELKLMASAYHDLASRLQLNNVILARRAEAPKSWLGVQRKLREGPTGISR